MTDLFENTILCKDCNKKLTESFILKNGFKIRTINCTKCNKQWEHPTDLEAYKRYSNVRNKNFHVKLRMVGNSYAVSIPHEIVEFAKLEKEMNKLIHMSLEEPGKLSMFFYKKFIKEDLRDLDEDERE